jgi:predicted acetyltransferase
MAAFLSTAWFNRVPWVRPRAFPFLNSGWLRDEELELIEPSTEWVESVLASARDAKTGREAPDLAGLTRRQLREFLSSCPGGRQDGPTSGMAPAYHFWMRDHTRADLPIAGAVALRVGHTDDLELYYGHIGYHVYPAHRGRHFAERAVRLLLPLARQHGINPLWITCNPDNGPSFRTCQRLGATLVETVAVPTGHPLRLRGEVAKCRFRIDHAADVDSRRTS